MQKTVFIFLVSWLVCFGTVSGASEPTKPVNKQVWIEPVTGMEFIWIPGSSSKPRLGGFWMGRYEVTQGQWKRIMKASPFHHNIITGDEYPVSNISWNECREFIELLNGGGPHTFGLPTEAQWTYAARAGTRTIRFWGDDPARACKYANVFDLCTKKKFHYWWQNHNCDDGYAGPAPVGRFMPNAFGLYDMLGNVWEMCADNYFKGVEFNSVHNIPETARYPRRSIRGGSWHDPPWYVRSAHRAWVDESYRHFTLGFRMIKRG